MNTASKAVFLSYASQDAEAARRICEALRADGVEVWFDADGGLEHGDEWDAKIRKQIKECVLFIPIISANTQARLEGYFRLEWELAAQRAMSIASGVPFILPVVIDDTREPEALVPDRFRKVQWMRLPGGGVSPQVQARLLKLWSHRTGATASRGPGPQTAARTPNESIAGTSVSSARRRRGILVAAASAMVLGAGFGWWWAQGRRSAEGAPRAQQSAAPAKPQTEAQRLVAKAWEVLNGVPEPFRSELEVAGDLCRRAAEADDTDADVWATWAQVESWYVAHGLDNSASRQESARAKAARAMKLAPASFEARYAHACTLLRAVGYAKESLFTPEAEAALRQLLRERPDEPRVISSLAYLLYGKFKARGGAVDEIVALFERLARNPACAAAAYNGIGKLMLDAGRHDDALAAAEKSIAVRPFFGNLYLRVRLALDWFGDLDRAKTAAEKMPAAELRENDQVAVAVARLYWYRREPKPMLQLLSAIPRTWFQTGALDAPKDYWIGLAHQLNGDTRAAERAWRAALRLIEEREGTPEETLRFAARKAELQALLGNPAPDEHVRAARAAGKRPLRSISILRGDFEAVEDGLKQLPWATLRFSPEFDPLRSDPRFLALLAEAEKDPRRSPQANKSAAASPSANSVAADKSVAVLAFENLSGDKDNEYFSDGISEELLNALAKVRGLRVAARTSAFYFKGKNVTAQEIGQKLGVAHLVDGSVQRDGAIVRVRARLSRADTGEQLWSDRFEGELKNIFALQDEIAGRIAENLKLRLAVSTRTANPVNPEAHRLYLEGRHFWSHRTETGFARAERAFSQALEREPTFARAHAGLADLWTMQWLWKAVSGNVTSTDVLLRAESAARKALEFEPSLAEAHATFGMIHLCTNRVSEAGLEFERCIAAAPSYATGRNWRAEFMVAQGRLDLARHDFVAAAQLDPLSPIMLNDCAEMLQRFGRAAEALEYANGCLALNPDSAMARCLQARALLDLGRNDEALSSVRQFIASPEATGTARVLASTAIEVLRGCGREADAVSLATSIADGLASDSFLRGNLLAALGRFEEALPLLAKSPGWSIRRNFWKGTFDAIRHDARFLKIIADAGCSEQYRLARETLARMQREKETGK